MIHILDALFNYYSGFPILIATLFFVVGQVFLKKSFNNDNDFVDTTLYYNAFMGILSFVLLMIKYRNNTLNTNLQKITYSSIAGVLFFVGVLLWVYTISTNKPLSIISVLMAGFETVLLILLGYFLFSHKLNWREILGILIILIGVYLVGNGKN